MHRLFGQGGSMKPDEKNATSDSDQNESMNYNDRLDGYGFGEAESSDDSRDYEHDPHFTKHCIDMGEGYRSHKDEPWSTDENGLRNQYGPVDQYSFRDVHFSIRIWRKKEIVVEDETNQDEEKA